MRDTETDRQLRAEIVVEKWKEQQRRVKTLTQDSSLVHWLLSSIYLFVSISNSNLPLLILHPSFII